MVLAVAGLAVVLSAFGASFLGLALSPWYLALPVGLVVLIVGIYIVKGGPVTP